jgi:hypothetical protein
MTSSRPASKTARGENANPKVAQAYDAIRGKYDEMVGRFGEQVAREAFESVRQDLSLAIREKHTRGCNPRG